jgi:(2Fe-2S) ferredoxin
MPPPYRLHVFVCTNERPADSPKPSCKRRGSEAVLTAFKKAIKDEGLLTEVRANESGCLDACDSGISVVVYPEAVWYGGVRVEDVAEIVRSHLLEGRPVERLRRRAQGGATSPGA